MVLLDARIEWFARYWGLSDPNVAATEIDGTPGVAPVASEVLDTEAQAILAAVEPVGNAYTEIRLGWSEPSAGDTVARFVAALRGSGDAIVRIRRALMETETSIRMQRALFEQLVAGANATAIHWPTDTLQEAAPEIHLHAKLTIESLNRQLGAIQAGIAAALKELRDVLYADPTLPADSLTIGTRAVAPPPPRAEGAPSAIRADQENRAKLAADLAGSDRIRARFAQGVLTALHQTTEPTQLLTYNPDAYGRQGAASISIGDLSTADYVTLYTPGVANSPSNMAGTVQEFSAIRDEIESRGPQGKVAVVLWFNYDIPISIAGGGGIPDLIVATEDTLRALNDRIALHSAPALAADVRAVRAMAEEGAVVTTVGHSMGSVVVAAASTHEGAADATVLLASPGASAAMKSAADYRGNSRKFYVGSYDSDPITRGITDVFSTVVRPKLEAPFSPFGPDPADKDFGAQRIDAQTNAPVSRIPAAALANSAYLLASFTAVQIKNIGSQHVSTNYTAGAMRQNMTAISKGQYSEVHTQPGR